MSFDRRWLLTSSAAALVGSFFRPAEAAPPPQKAGSGSVKGETPADFIDIFKKGWPRKPTKDEEKVIQDALEAAYQDRFKARIGKMNDLEKERLKGFARDLGLLTYACLENNRKGTCGWDAAPTVKLSRVHVETARDLLGFYLNLPPEKRCDPTGYKMMQPEEPCPLCPMP